jgi:alpha-ribazole phosphatase
VILYLLRHPKPLVAPGICYGQLDLPAVDVNVAAAALKPLLPAGIPVWSSPLLRCRALAECLVEASDRTVQVDARLMEMHFGRWEGVAWDAIPRDELDQWAAAVESYVPPAGESACQVQQRAVACIEALPGEAAIVVTHAGVIRLLRAHYEHLPLADLLQVPIDYASLTILRC